ncbi:MAG: TPM domain-containing protein [Firmicutes bacterium]|nr:TPM domain-containing protein [Bacillota bacterium]
MRKQIFPRPAVSVLCAAVIMLLPALAAYAVVQPTRAFYVNDSADVLTAATEEYIVSTGSSLAAQTGAQIVVVTIPTLGGGSLEEYATELFRTWGIGDKEQNNGLLLLCAVEDRLFRVEVGYGLEGDLPDGKTGRMQDEYLIPYLRQNLFDEGIKNCYNAFLAEVAAIYGVTVTADAPVSPNAAGSVSGEVMSAVVGGPLVLMLAGLVLLSGTLLRKLLFGGVSAAVFAFGWLTLGSFPGALLLTISGLVLAFYTKKIADHKPTKRIYDDNDDDYHRYGGFGGGFRGGGFGGGFGGGGGFSGGGGSSRGF